MLWIPTPANLDSENDDKLSMRNTFETHVAQQLGRAYQYEAVRLSYTIQHTYTPDFICPATMTIVEAKGFFPAADRKKMLAVKAQHPQYTIRIIFQNAQRTISKASSTTYGEWATKHGFAWEEAVKAVKSSSKAVTAQNP